METICNHIFHQVLVDNERIPTYTYPHGPWECEYELENIQKLKPLVRTFNHCSYISKEVLFILGKPVGFFPDRTFRDFIASKSVDRRF